MEYNIITTEAVCAYTVLLSEGLCRYFADHSVQFVKNIFVINIFLKTTLVELLIT